MHAALMADKLDWCPKLVAARRCPPELNGIWVPMDTTEITTYPRSDRTYLAADSTRPLDPSLHDAFCEISVRQRTEPLTLRDSAYLGVWPWNAFWGPVRSRDAKWANDVAEFAAEYQARLIFLDPDQGAAFPDRQVNKTRPWSFFFGGELQTWWREGFTVAWYQHVDRKSDLHSRLLAFVIQNAPGARTMWTLRRNRARIIVVPQRVESCLIRKWCDTLSSAMHVEETVIS